MASQKPRTSGSAEESMSCPGHSNDPARCGALIRCPYNENHHSDPRNFAEHLRECRREYCSRNCNSIPFVRCPYNSRHHIPQIELEFHKKICDNYHHEAIVEQLKTAPNPLPGDESPTPSDSEDDSGSTSSCDTTTSEAEEERQESV